VNVTIQHIRQAREKHGGYCPGGIRYWCERHGLDFRKALTQGYPIEEIEAIDDVFAKRVVAIAKGEQ